VIWLSALLLLLGLVAPKQAAAGGILTSLVRIGLTLKIWLTLKA